MNKKEDIYEELPLFIIEKEYGQGEAGEPLGFLH